MNVRQQMLTALVLAAALLVILNGCAAVPDQWDEYATRKPLPAVVMRVSPSELWTRCQRHDVMGCAVRDNRLGVCSIYVDVAPLPDTIAHELLHCAGFQHNEPGITPRIFTIR